MTHLLLVQPSTPDHLKCRQRRKPMSNKDIERRRHRRIPVSLPVNISTIDPEKQAGSGQNLYRLSRDTCLNLSRSGALVKMTDCVAPGTRVLVELHLPGHGLFEVVGRVAWKKDGLSSREKKMDRGIGVEFIGTGKTKFSSLSDYLLEASMANFERRVANIR